MNATDLVQWIAASAFPLSVIAVAVNRYHTGRGIGARSIQFVVAAMVVPAVLILTVQGLVGGEASVALIAALVGFLFGSFAKFDDR